MNPYEVVVIGGGQAGLAAGHFLAAQSRRFVILEAADAPAAAWRARWDSLRLFTPARYDGLPGRPFPGDPDRYPTRDEVVGYLEAYARDLPVQYGSRVGALRTSGDGGYAIECAGRTVLAEQVVVATGPFQSPRVPGFAASLDAGIAQLHSVAYRHPAQIAPGRVLVVGGGNTGFQIAEELSRTHEVHLAVGTRQRPLPQRPLGRDLFDLLTAAGAMRKTVDSRIGRRMKDREMLIGSSPRRARRLGVRLHGRATAQSVAAIAPATVVWATGFGVDHGWIEAPVFDGEGRLEHARGVTSSPGLYFLGLPWQHTRGSALLGWVGDDAAFLAGRIADRAGFRVPSTGRPLMSV